MPQCPAHRAVAAYSCHTTACTVAESHPTSAITSLSALIYRIITAILVAMIELKVLDVSGQNGTESLSYYDCRVLR